MKKIVLIVLLSLPSLVMSGGYGSTTQTDIFGCWTFKEIEITKIDLLTGEIISAMIISSEIDNGKNASIDDFIIANLCANEEDRSFVLTTKSSKTYFGDLDESISTQVNIDASDVNGKSYRHKFTVSKVDGLLNLSKDFYSDDRKSKSVLRMVLTKLK